MWKLIFLEFVFRFRYGIGMIYYKQEKLALAEVHFRKALQINPQSSVLMCHIGVVRFRAYVSDLSR